MNHTESHTSPRVISPTRFIALAVLVLLAATANVALAQKAKPATARQVKQYTIEQFMDTTRITGASFSPDEKQILFASNKTGIFNVYTIAATGGAPPQQDRKSVV